jgi:type I site-specific restriction endonuclease
MRLPSYQGSPPRRHSCNNACLTPTLKALLDKYADEGIDSIEALDILRVQPFDRFGTPVEIIQRFGGRPQYLRALQQLEAQLYLAA